MNDHVVISSAMRARALEIADVIRRLSGASPWSRSRQRPFATSRMIACTKLLQEGWTEHQVGAVFGIDHSTVHYYRVRMREMETMPGYDAEREILARFRAIIDASNT